MRAGVNGWRLHGRRTGVGRYLLNVVRNWTPELVSDRFDELNLYTPKPFDPDLELPETVTERVVGPEVRLLVWENLRLAAAADDVLFCPSYTRPLVARGKTVVTTHDATMHMYPELYARSGPLFYDRLYGWCARHATLVITTSETVKRDVARCYGVPPERIRVVQLATDDQVSPVTDETVLGETRERYLGADVPFFLFVGKLTARRNAGMLVEAFAELKQREALPHKLLVVGLDTQDLGLAALVERLGIGDHVVHVEYVPDGDLNLLYNAAETFIMPSTFETLSLTVMESQAVGTPVITIDTPGLRETSGGAAYLMPRADAGEVVKAMSRLAGDASLRAELAEAGRAQAARLSWRRCAQETLDVLAEAAELPAPSRSSAGAAASPA
jgi:glycosyltransferase involved in cell wall biosynthesis